jgi:hypothetical protein
MAPFTGETMETLGGVLSKTGVGTGVGVAVGDGAAVGAGVAVAVGAGAGEGVGVGVAVSIGVGVGAVAPVAKIEFLQLPPQICERFAVQGILHSDSATFVYPITLPPKQYPPYCRPAYESPRDLAAEMQDSIVAPELISCSGSARLASSV